MYHKGRAKTPGPINPARGEQMGTARLTEEKVRQMRALYATGTISYPELAKQFGVALYTTWAAVTRHTWKHVE